MNPKLDAGLAKRLQKVWINAVMQSADVCDAKFGWLAVETEVRKLVKEAKEGK